jgi:hypothetical protein
MKHHNPMIRCGLLLIAAIPLLTPGGAAAKDSGLGRLLEVGRPLDGGKPQDADQPPAEGGGHTPFESDDRSIPENAGMVAGWIRQIDLAGEITLVDEQGRSVRLHQASSAIVTVGREIVSLENLPVGVLAVARFFRDANGGAAFFTALAVPGAAAGPSGAPGVADLDLLGKALPRTEIAKRTVGAGQVIEIIERTVGAGQVIEIIARTVGAGQVIEIIKRTPAPDPVAEIIQHVLSKKGLAEP